MSMLFASFVLGQVNHTLLTPNGSELENDMEGKGIHYYKIKIPEEINHQADLVISVTPRDSKSDPDVHISETKQDPTSVKDSKYSCAMVGEDICTVPSSALSPGKTFYVGVKCYRQCEYKIKADFQTEIEIKGREDKTFKLGGGDRKILYFVNPHPGVKDLIFTARANPKTTSMRMYIKEGKDSTPTSSDMRSSDGWEDGIVIRLSEKTMVKVKDEETYKILLEVDSPATIVFRVDLVYSEKMVEEGEAYDDYVNFNDKTCYKYIVKNADRKLRVGAYSFSGNPDIYVNPATNPDSLDSYAFKATETSDDVLVLTPKDREEVGSKKGLYYICVVGHSNSSYRLRISESDQDFYLEDGIAETNEVESGKEISFYYTDDALIRDLNITFTLSIKSGPAPDMYVKFCGRTPEDQCIIGSRTAPDVIKAASEVGSRLYTIEHQGSRCREGSQEQPCTYVIEVAAPKAVVGTEVSHFALVAQHTETTHIQLREAISIEQVIENHQTRYFMFIVRDSLTSKVTFTVNSHHGDADIYTSRSEKYPDSKNNDRSSVRSRRFADEVTYKSDNGESLMGVYYIAVKGYEYSSFSIKASIIRSDHEDVSKIVPIQLSEGVPMNEFIDNGDKKYYQFKTSMYGEAITDIRVSVTQVVGDFTFYVKSGSIPTESDFDYKSDNGSDIIMRTKDKKFEAVGMKYILVVPSERYGVNSSNLRYSIKYNTERTVNVIKRDVPSFGTVKIGTYKYYKYLNLDKGSQFTVSLTPLSGDANLVVSLDHKNSFPTVAENDEHSAKVGSDSISITGDRMFSTNPTCKPSEQHLLGGKPCEVFIGVYCSDKNHMAESREKDSCSYSLKVYHEFGLPHMLIDGIPQRDSVKAKDFIYYFMPVQTEREYLYVAATAENKGDIRIYVSFSDAREDYDDAELPSASNHVKNSKGVGHSQTIHFSKKDVQKNCKNYRECMALIGVQGNGDDVEFNDFNLVAYTHIPRLMVNTPMVSKVDKGTMSYFTYKSFCEDCSIIISASAYSVEADIDLFINFGHKKNLPTKTNYDIKSDIWFSEHVTLDTDHEYFKKQGIKSMQETFIIGVYAKEDATVAIEIEETTSKIRTLKHGKSVTIDQEPNEVHFFRYTHKEDSSLKFELTMLSGTVNMRINQFDEFENDSPEHKFLPDRDESALWTSNSRANPTIRIHKEDEDYCSTCTYLIGIESHSAGAKYTIQVDKDDFTTNKQIKLGVPLKDQVYGDDFKQYMFVLDRKKEFTVSVSVYLGEVEFSIGDEKDYESPILKAKNESIVVDKSYLDYFEEGDNVYIRVKGLYEHSEYIVMATHQDSYTILPDSYTQEFTINPYDTKGINIMYYPPSLEFELAVSLHSLSDGIEYMVYSKKVYVENISGDLDFPYKHDSEFEGGQWDMNRRSFTQKIIENPERDDPYILLFTVIPRVTHEESLVNKKKVKFTLNMNSHEVNLLMPNIPIEVESRPEKNNYRFFKFFANGNKDIEIVITPCVCDHDAFVFQHLDDAYSSSSPKYRSSHMQYGSKRVSIQNANGPYFVKVLQNHDSTDSEYMKSVGQCVFEIVFIDKANENYKYSLDQYVPENEGRVDYSWPTFKRIMFKWGRIMKNTPTGQIPHPSVASLYLITAKPNIFMGSVCGMKHAVARGEAKLLNGGITEHESRQNPRIHAFSKKNKYATYQVIASVNREGGAIPYQPVRLNIRIPWYVTIPWYMYVIFFSIIGGLGYTAYYFRKKAKVTQSKLDFEMNDIRNVARVGYADDGAEAAHLKRPQQNTSILEEESVV